MIDLRNTCVLVRTPEENKKLLKEAEEQGFYWYGKDDCKPLLTQQFPGILKFYKEKDITHSANIELGYTFYEASELIGTKEMTAREFIERFIDLCNCSGRNYSDCVLCEINTKHNEALCDTKRWKNNIDEILEIAKSGRFTVLPTEEKAISTIEKFIENPDYTALNDEFVEALKLAVKKLREVER